MKITWLGHSGFRIEIEGKVLLIDPWLQGNPMFPEDRAAEATEGATHVLVSHGHADHSSAAIGLAQELSIPVVGNGDIASGEDLKHRKETTAVSGVMIGRAAMQNPWIFREAKHFLATGEQLPPVPMQERWQLIRRHCHLAIQSDRYGNERQTMMAMRSRLMAYCKGFPGAKDLRQRLCQVSSLDEIEDIAADHLEEVEKLAVA